MTCYIIFTRYSTALSVGHFFILRKNQGLISSVGALPSSVVLYYILVTQLFLRPQHVYYSEHRSVQPLSQQISIAPWINSQQEHLFKVVQTYLESMHPETIQETSNEITISGCPNNLSNKGGQGVGGDEGR
jgi:hypothetical protein